MNKRKHQDVTFLNHSKENPDEQPLPTKKTKFTCTDVKGRDKYKVVLWMKDHPNKSAYISDLVRF